MGNISAREYCAIELLKTLVAQQNIVNNETISAVVNMADSLLEQLAKTKKK